jgi:hypothetical protein
LKTNKPGKRVRRIPLEDATTPAQAKRKLKDVVVSRRKLPVLKLAPKFSEYAEKYLACHRDAKDAMCVSTIKTEGYLWPCP